MIEGAPGVEPAACYINIRFSVTDERPTAPIGAINTDLHLSVPETPGFLYGIQTFVCFHLFKSNCYFRRYSFTHRKYSFALTPAESQCPIHNIHSALCIICGWLYTGKYTLGLPQPRIRQPPSRGPICDNRNHLYMLIYSPILRILVVLQQIGKQFCVVSYIAPLLRERLYINLEWRLRCCLWCRILRNVGSPYNTITLRTCSIHSLTPET